jgi:pimeloyl-ACP methyl ester carboxylesterase/DNA-binding SARP family transcriptional activator
MLCLLGSPAIRIDGHLQPLRLRPKALALLVRLTVDGVVTRAELAGSLFAEAENPRATLRWHLSYLRQHLPEPITQRLIATPDAVQSQSESDVNIFRAGTGRIVDQPGSIDAAQLLSLYRGDLGTGATLGSSPVFDNWLYVEQERLRRAFRQATVAYARYVAAEGRAGEAAEALAKLVSVDPYFEDGHILLIGAYEALNRRDAAAVSYRRYRQVVKEELQAEPRPAVRRRYEPETPAGRTLPLDGLVGLREITLHLLDWPGDEPTILAIHGSAMSGYALTPLAERLAPHVRVVAADLRGHGLSDKPPGGYDVARHGADMRELIELLHLCSPIVLGFSLGGAIAAAVAAAGSVRGLILLDAVIGDRAFTENAAAQVMQHLGGTFARRHGGFSEYLTNWRATRGTYSDDSERLLERVTRYVLTPLPDGSYRQRGIRTALEQTWASLTQVDSLGVLAQVRCPILIVQATLPWIDQQPYLTDAIIEEQVRAAPGAQRFIAHHSNHPSLVHDPEPGLLDAIRTFTRMVR